MKNLLPKTEQRQRKNRIVGVSATLFRERGAADWRLALRFGGKRSVILDAGTTIESSAKEFAIAAVRQATFLQPYVSSTSLENRQIELI